MKRSIFVLAAFFIFSIALSGCGSKTTSNGSTEKMITIGITQIVEHPALDSAREGFIKALKDNGYVEGKNVTFIQENAQGDMSTAQTIAKKFVDKNVDLIFSIATPTTQAVKKQLQLFQSYLRLLQIL
jgi:ABC transporter substrate binding protein.